MAAAEQNAEVKVSILTLSSELWDELQKLPADEQSKRVESLKAEELRDLIVLLGHPKGGTKAENILKVLERLDSSHTPASPEGRQGRARSPKPGKSAYALRSSVTAQQASSSTGNAASSGVNAQNVDAMSVDGRKWAFAFTGFPVDADQRVIYELIREYLVDYLGKFELECVGTCKLKGQVGVIYPVNQCEALKAQMFN